MSLKSDSILRDANMQIEKYLDEGLVGKVYFWLQHVVKACMQMCPEKIFRLKGNQNCVASGVDVGL